MSDAEAGLAEFFEAAGRSLQEAQVALVGNLEAVPTQMAIGEAELELRTAMRAGSDGKVVLTTLSLADVRKGDISPDLLSTVKVRLVAVADDPLVPAAPPPHRPPSKVVDEVRQRPDVVVLDRILDGLVLDAVFVPQTRRWLVSARDSAGRLVREVVVPDEEK